jgi:hypothetical protein
VDKSQCTFGPLPAMVTVDPSHVNIWRDGIPSITDISEQACHGPEVRDTTSKLRKLGYLTEPTPEGWEDQVDWDESRYLSGGTHSSITDAVCQAIDVANSRLDRPSSLENLKSYSDDFVSELALQISNPPPAIPETEDPIAEGVAAPSESEVIEAIHDSLLKNKGAAASLDETIVRNFVESLHAQGYVLTKLPETATLAADSSAPAETPEQGPEQHDTSRDDAHLEIPPVNKNTKPHTPQPPSPPPDSTAPLTTEPKHQTAEAKRSRPSRPQILARPPPLKRAPRPSSRPAPIT